MCDHTSEYLPHGENQFTTATAPGPMSLMVSAGVCWASESACSDSEQLRACRRIHSLLQEPQCACTGVAISFHFAPIRCRAPTGRSSLRLAGCEVNGSSFFSAIDRNLRNRHDGDVVFLPESACGLCNEFNRRTASKQNLRALEPI